MNWLVAATAGAVPAAVELAEPEVAEPEIESRPEPAEGDPAHDWLCAWCHQRVASEKDRFALEGRSEFSFRNPEGLRFDIITFARALGCREVGVPTLEHTWFAGHAWTFCLCGRCRTHLGWYWVGPSRFVGLIRPRIVRAVTVMN